MPINHNSILFDSNNQLKFQTINNNNTGFIVQQSPGINLLNTTNELDNKKKKKKSKGLEKSTKKNSKNRKQEENNIKKNGKYQCDICQKTFVNMYNKRRHYEMVHNQILQKLTTTAQQQQLQQQQQQQQSHQGLIQHQQHQNHQQQLQQLQQQQSQQQQRTLPPSAVQFVQTFVPTLATTNPFAANAAAQQILTISAEHAAANPSMMMAAAASSSSLMAAAGNPVAAAFHHQQQQQHLHTTSSNTTTEKEKKTILCEICNKTFSTTYNKRRHDEMVHGQNSGLRMAPKYKCSSCDKVFSSIYNKTRHENIHKPINERLKHICPKCNKGFTTSFILKSHLQKIHQIL